MDVINNHWEKEHLEEESYNHQLRYSFFFINNVTHEDLEVSHTKNLKAMEQLKWKHFIYAGVTHSFIWLARSKDANGQFPKLYFGLPI